MKSVDEILDMLNDGTWYEELDLTGTMWIKLRWKETQLLLNYITNLQKRIDNAIKYIESFAYYIPEDSKPELLDILKPNDNTLKSDIKKFLSKNLILDDNHQGLWILNNDDKERLFAMLGGDE